MFLAVRRSCKLSRKGKSLYPNTKKTQKVFEWVFLLTPAYAQGFSLSPSSYKMVITFVLTSKAPNDFKNPMSKHRLKWNYSFTKSSKHNWCIASSIVLNPLNPMTHLLPQQTVIVMSINVADKIINIRVHV